MESMSFVIHDSVALSVTAVTVVNIIQFTVDWTVVGATRAFDICNEMISLVVYVLITHLC